MWERANAAAVVLSSSTDSTSTSTSSKKKTHNELADFRSLGVIEPVCICVSGMEWGVSKPNTVYLHACVTCLATPAAHISYQGIDLTHMLPLLTHTAQTH